MIITISLDLTLSNSLNESYSGIPKYEPNNSTEKRPWSASSRAHNMTTELLTVLEYSHGQIDYQSVDQNPQYI